MKYYLIGIKGAGMSTLACILYDLGNEVSGYDDTITYKFTEEGLVKRGIKIYNTNEHSLDKDMIVSYSEAFSKDHKEILRVKELGLYIKSYHEILGDLTKMFSSICVAGTHGKTTTSLLISHILINTIGCNYFVGDGSGFANKDNKLFVIESCEFNKHFLAYHPDTTIITNIELEHVECYNGIEDIINTFSTLANKSTNKIIACGDDLNVQKMIVNKKIIYYGFNENNNVVAKNIELNENGNKFDVFYDNQLLGNFYLPAYGKHMILNALAAIIVCLDNNISIEDIKKHMQTFQGAKRRFKETIIGNRVIIDDYAHHPTEVSVTLDAARQKYPNKTIIGLLKPNTYTRTRALYKDFAKALNKADHAFVTDIYCDREKKEDYPSITSDLIINLLNNGEHIGLDSIDKLLQYDNSVVCFMSCKDINSLKDAYINLIK